MLSHREIVEAMLMKWNWWQDYDDWWRWEPVHQRGFHSPSCKTLHGWTPSQVEDLLITKIMIMLMVRMSMNKMNIVFDYFSSTLGLLSLLLTGWWARNWGASKGNKGAGGHSGKYFENRFAFDPGFSCLWPLTNLPSFQVYLHFATIAFTRCGTELFCSAQKLFWWRCQWCWRPERLSLEWGR